MRVGKESIKPEKDWTGQDQKHVLCRQRVDT